MNVPMVFQRIRRSVERTGVKTGRIQPELSVVGDQDAVSLISVWITCWSIARSGPSPVLTMALLSRDSLQNVS